MEKDRMMIFKQLPFHVGVKCMEQSVMELDEAVREFMTTSSNPNPLNVTSWKFPQVKLEKLDVGTIVRNLRAQNLPGDIHYIHLAELLIDRLYFSLLSSIRFVTILTNIAYGARSDQPEARPISGGGGDDMGGDGSFLGLSVVNPLCSGSKTFNTNMALVIRHLQMLFNDLESGVGQLVAKTRKFESAFQGIDEKSSVAPKPATRFCLTQTEISSIECCEVCSISQETIKKVGELLESCLQRISPNKEQNANAAARSEITKNFYNASQWSALRRWCDALNLTAEEISFVITENVKRNSELEQDLKKTTHLLNTNNRDHLLATQRLEKKISSLENQVIARKKEKTEADEAQNLLQKKVEELEAKLSKRDEELKNVIAEKDATTEALRTLEKTHQDLKYAQTTHSQTLRRIQQDLVAEQKYKEKVQENLQTLEGSNRKYRLEIAKLKSDVGILSTEKTQLETDSNELKKSLSQALEDAKEKRASEIEKLKKDLKSAEQKIELLTLYPDLNGPINTPQSENENVVKTMENQLKGNTMRVQVLLQQSEKLANTLRKVKAAAKK